MLDAPSAVARRKKNPQVTESNITSILYALDGEEESWFKKFLLFYFFNEKWWFSNFCYFDYVHSFSSFPNLRLR